MNHDHNIMRMNAIAFMLGGAGVAALPGVSLAQDLKPRMPVTIDDMRLDAESELERAFLRSQAQPFRRTIDATRANPHPWAPMLDGDDYFDDFESYTPHTALSPDSSWFELAGQVSPAGTVWGAAADYNGVVNNAIAQTGANWNPAGVGESRHGHPGGPDPTGEHGQFFASPRGSIASQPALTGNFFVARTTHPLYMPRTDEAAITMIDVYMDDIDTMLWWRPIGDLITASILLGGYDFQYFSPFVNASYIADRMILLGPSVGQASSGEFWGNADPYHIQTGEWFTVAVRVGIDSFSVWVRDSTTIGVYGFEQDSVYDGFPGDPARGAFAGEPLATDFVQVFPGVEDDPSTTLREGNGPAFNLFNQSPRVHLDTTGGPAGTQLFYNSGVGGTHLIGGSDPDPSDIPGYKPNDWYVDNYTVIGTPYTYPDLAPFELPFIDDFEDCPLGPAFYWSYVDRSQAFSDDLNHTPGGSRAFRDQVTWADRLFIERACREVPRTLAQPGAPTRVTAWLHQTGPRASKSLHGETRSSKAGPAASTAFGVLLGATDSGGAIDDRVYARVPNPNFDPSQPEALTPQANELHVPGANTRFVNAPLVDALGLPLTTPTDAWFEVEIEIGAPDTLRVFVNGVEGFADGAVEGVTTLAAGALSFNYFAVYGSAGDASVGHTWWLDDFVLDGPAFPVPTPLTIGDPVFTNPPAFALPYTDDFEGYEQRALDGQGATPWLGALFSDISSELDIIALDAGQTVDTSTLGYSYTIDTVLSGALPGGAGANETVFVVNNIAPVLPPGNQPVPGSTPSGNQPATRVNFRDANLAVTAEADWRLVSTTPAPWDGAATVVGRYWFEYTPRWAGAIGDESVITDAINFPSNGALAALRISESSENANLGGDKQILAATLPEARPGPGRKARLEFDLWIAIDDPQVGPRGRLVWEIKGPGANPGTVASIVFGGPNNYLDENTFDPVSGAITPNPDNFPDDYFRGQPLTPGGPPTYADPTRLYVLKRNAVQGFGRPEFLLDQTAYTVPGNGWIRCVAEIDEDGDWVITLDDGTRAPFVVSGAALQAGQFDMQGTSGLALNAGFDAGADGAQAPGVVMWTSPGPAAFPEGGSAPLPTGAAGWLNGSYNEFADPEYLYFQVFEIWQGSTNLPQVTEVDPPTGTIIGTRNLQQGDIVALWNDQSTVATGGAAGVPFASAPSTLEHWWTTSDGGATIDARGVWIPLGLPGERGAESPAPNGGIVNSTPPYNSALPFETIVMGSIVDYPDTGVLPPAAWFIDNISLDVVGCLGDLTGDGAVDGADFGLLLGAWGTSNPDADLNASGVVDGADLGLLLGAWGSCE